MTPSPPIPIRNPNTAPVEFNEVPRRNWSRRRWPSFGALLVRLLLWIAKMLMPAPSQGALLFIDRSRMLATKFERFMPRPPPEVQIERFQIGETPAWWIRAPGVSNGKVLFYLQGGGLILGSPNTTHRDLLWRLSAACDCAVLAIAYGLAPEHRYPVARDQALQAWRFLLERYPANSLALAGDSAGGSLALSIALRIRDLGLPKPAALCLLSPQTDLTGSGDSVLRNFHKDFVIPGDAIRMIGELYADGAPLDHPYVSPMFGAFHDFPPTLLQASGEEVFLDDSTRVAEKMRAAGVPVVLDVWKGMPHVWHGFAALMPEARAAIEDLGRFVRGHVRDSGVEVASRDRIGVGPADQQSA